MGVQRHASAALPPGKTRYPLYRRLGGPQGRSGLTQKISHLPEFDPRNVQPAASRYTEYAIYKVTLLTEHHMMIDKEPISTAIKIMNLKLYACLIFTYHVVRWTAVMQLVRPTHVHVAKCLLHMMIWLQQQSK